MSRQLAALRNPLRRPLVGQRRSRQLQLADNICGFTTASARAAQFFTQSPFLQAKAEPAPRASLIPDDVSISQNSELEEAFFLGNDLASISADSGPGPPSSSTLLNGTGSNVPSKIITTDYRIPTHSQINEERGAQSLWDQTFRRCITPIQLRITVSRLMTQENTPKQEDVISAFNACARLALFGGKGIALAVKQTGSNGGHAKEKSHTPHRPAPKAQHYQRASFEIAQSLMRDLVKRGTIPNLHMYSAYIRVCAHAGQVDAAFYALEDLKRNGIVPDSEIYKGLIMASARHGDLPRALNTVQASVQTVSSISRHAKWLRMALRMAVGIEAGKWLGIAVSLATGMNEVATQIIGIGFGTVFGMRLVIPVIMPLPSGKSLLQESLKPPSAIQPFTDMESSPVNSHFSEMHYAHKESNGVFHSLDAAEVNQHMHNYLLAVLEESGKVEEVIVVLDGMREKGIPVTIATFNALVYDLIQKNMPDLAIDTIKHMASVSPTTATFYPVLQYFYDRRNFAETIHIFETLLIPRNVKMDLATYTCLISCYGKNNQVEEASNLFQELLQLGFRPTLFVLNTLISIFAKNGRYREAEDILIETMPKYSITPSSRSYTKLIDKARFIDVEKYTAPRDVFQAPPIPYPAGGNPVRKELPIQVQRAWHWYNVLRSTQGVDSSVTVSAMMITFMDHGMHDFAVGVYRECVGVPQDQPPLLLHRYSKPRGQSLANNFGSQENVWPNQGTYYLLFRALSNLPNYPLGISLALLYELKARRGWHYHLPAPKEDKSLARIVDATFGSSFPPISSEENVFEWVSVHRSGMKLQFVLNRILAEDVSRHDPPLVQIALRSCGSYFTAVFQREEARPLLNEALPNFDDNRPCLFDGIIQRSSTKVASSASPALLDDEDDDDIIRVGSDSASSLDFTATPSNIISATPSQSEPTSSSKSSQKGIPQSLGASYQRLRKLANVRTQKTLRYQGSSSQPFKSACRWDSNSIYPYQRKQHDHYKPSHALHQNHQ